MALHHAASGEIIDVRPLGKKLHQDIPVTLVKTAHLQIFRYILLEGKEFAEHKVHGEITIQCLEGVIEFASQSRKKLLRAGELVYLAGDDPHALKGIEDAWAGDNCFEQTDLRSRSTERSGNPSHNSSTSKCI